MNNKWTRRTVYFVYGIVFLILGSIFFKNRGGFAFLQRADLKIASSYLFPLSGLYAIFLVWVQVTIGPNLRYLRRFLPRIYRFHKIEGLFALTFAITHALLMLIGSGLNNFIHFTYVSPSLILFAWLGEIQILIIATTVTTAFFMRVPWLVGRWHYIHFLNYVLFIMVWIHSWFLGSDVRFTFLKYVWIFFALSALAASFKRIRTHVFPALLAAIKKPR